MAKDDCSGFLAGLLVGGVVGIAIALLYAPRGGQAQRGALVGRAASFWVDDAETVLEQSRSALRARFEGAAAAAQ